LTQRVAGGEPHVSDADRVIGQRRHLHDTVAELGSNGEAISNG